MPHTASMVKVALPIKLSKIRKSPTGKVYSFQGRYLDHSGTSTRWGFFVLILFFSATQAFDYTDEQIVNAIYRAENSVKYPYGVRSINTHGNKEYARKICLNSVRNARKRCAGQDLIVCMGKRYSPPAQNPNWVRLVRHFLCQR